VPIERALLQIAVIGANAIYGVLKLLPVQNKVVFISWDSDVVTPDFQALIDRLQMVLDAPKIVALCRELKSGVAAYIAYMFHLLHEMYEIATSKVVVLDSYCVMVSILHHRRGLRIVQIWHALGAFKKFGWSILDKSEGLSARSKLPSHSLARLLRMHAGYTDVVVSCSAAIPHFAEAFRCAPSKVHVAWLPRVDWLRNEAVMAELRERIVAVHPELAHGRVVLYAPTFRRMMMNPTPILSLVTALGAADWNVVVKPHSVTREIQIPSHIKMVRDIPDFTASELLAVADAVITDYSAIVYEAYLRHIPVYFYDHDLDAYKDARGFYTEPDAFPSKVYATADDLIADLDLDVFDGEGMDAFIEQFVEDSPNRVDILDLIDPGGQ